MALKKLLPLGVFGALASQAFFGSFELIVSTVDLWLPLLSQINTLPMVSIPHMTTISLVGTAFLIGRYVAKLLDKANDD